MTLISLMSVVVISLVVWLLLIFLSVTEGIEKTWLTKLTTLNGPVRINPTEHYFSSYYYQIDAVSSESDYSFKTIADKKLAQRTDPFRSDRDAQLPHSFPESDRHKDPVKQAFTILARLQKKYPGFAYQDYEVGGALLRVQLGRGAQQSFLTQASYVASYDPKNPYLKQLLMSPPQAAGKGEYGVLLPKSFQDNGVRVGDRGFLSYNAIAFSSVQEQRLPIAVAGFYDPGVMSIGNRYVLAPHELVHTIYTSSSAYSMDRTLSNGIQVWFKDLTQADQIKNELKKAFYEAGIDEYWAVTTYKDYDFAKDLLQQFQSDKYLFTLVGAIILLVACCNIISLLVILVNDKKKEIGILQAMGASKKSIAVIFGGCGMIMGAVSAVIGTGVALLTLANIDAIASLLSTLQGHDAFNAAFYGKSLPNELSQSALWFILIATPLLSLGAGLIPALKACHLDPATVLRSE